MENANFITLWLNDSPFVTILEKYTTFKKAAKKAQEYCQYNNDKNRVSFTINTPLTRKVNAH